MARPVEMSPPGSAQLFGLRIDAVTMEQVVARCRDAVIEQEPLLIGVVNAAKIVKMRSDATLRDSLLECDLLIADGQSIVWASRLLRRPLPERIAGIDLFEQLLRFSDLERRSVYLLGATPEVLQALEARIRDRYHNLEIVGSHDGYFEVARSADIAADIITAKPDMLFLGMASPKKENFLGTYGQRLEVPVMHGVGGSFDVLAGVTRRAPLRWQRAGMEWAYRLMQEPRRMWRRYLTTNTAFIALTIRELVRPSQQYRRRSASPEVRELKPSAPKDPAHRSTRRQPIKPPLDVPGA